MRLLLIIVLLMLLIGSWPTWPYAANWGVGYYPSGLFGFMVLLIIVMALVRGDRNSPRI